MGGGIGLAKKDLFVDILCFCSLMGIMWGPHGL